MTEPRRLKGHKAASTCCIASLLHPGLVATAAEDGRVCWSDLRCKDVLFTMDMGSESPISSLCFKPGNEDIVYVSSGNEVKCFDLHMPDSWKLLQNYNYNKEEINQIACHTKSSFLAAVDDTGDLKMCSSVQFLPWRSWEVITGGFDSKLLMWDFSRGRPNEIMDFGLGGDSGQSYNPAFVHALVVPDLDMVEKLGKICAIARGDGVISIINIDSELTALKSKTLAKSKICAKTISKNSIPSIDPQDQDGNYKKLHLDYTMGGHTASVSAVTFSMFGEKGKFVISGGNDKSVKVWDWSKSYDDAGNASSNNNLLSLNISLKNKVN